MRRSSQAAIVSLHDAVPISIAAGTGVGAGGATRATGVAEAPAVEATAGASTAGAVVAGVPTWSVTQSTMARRVLWRESSSTTSRSEEHTSELQSRENLVCRL